MTLQLRTTFTDDEIQAVWNVLGRLYDDLIHRNCGDEFQSRTVDLLGEADDVCKQISDQLDEEVPE
jgi:hypothetical protein